MSHLLALAGDLIILRIIWRARKWVTGGRNGMFETDSDARLRKIAGIFVILICLLGIYANHFIFRF